MYLCVDWRAKGRMNAAKRCQVLSMFFDTLWGDSLGGKRGWVEE